MHCAPRLLVRMPGAETWLPHATRCVTGNPLWKPYARRV